MTTRVNCPLKPGISCARTSEMVRSTPCPGCTAAGSSGRSRRPEPVRAKLIGVVRVRDGDRGLIR
jgi:hypothetical protein